MTPVQDELRSYFEAKALEYAAMSAPREIANLLVKGELTPERRAEVVNAHGLEKDPALHAIFLEWVIEFVQRMLAAGPVSVQDAQSLGPLKGCLGIREGDFIELRPIEVKTILCDQLASILEDGLLEEHEELAQLALQNAFDLGYDQYLGLTRPLYEAAMVDLRKARDKAPDQDLEGLYRRIQSLETVCTLAIAQPRSLGGLR
jgi:hypothetical protein